MRSRYGAQDTRTLQLRSRDSRVSGDEDRDAPGWNRRASSATEGTSQPPMISRTNTASLAGRATSMRRMRRRTSLSTSGRAYCGTNGCASFLVVDPTTEVASCPICGFTRRLN